MNDRKITILDTTLRDGAQSEGVNFSVEDKRQILKELDEFGIDFVEGGNPSSGASDREFFKSKGTALKNAKLVSFGSTVRKDLTPDKDENVKALINANTEIVTVFGKASKSHVLKILEVTEEKNLEMIKSTIKYLIKCGKRVFFDAEHYFDGYAEDKDYALKCIKCAERAGAELIVLCDTNGGSMEEIIRSGVKSAERAINVGLGIHCHNDCGLAVSNTLAAVDAGVRHVQGTFTGIGERCGNANLAVIIPNLQLKLNYDVISPDKLSDIKRVYNTLCELINTDADKSLAYVGSRAFAHKAGMHTAAVIKNSNSFEHINPEVVGNERRILISELSGKSALRYKINKYFNIDKDGEKLELILNELKQKEYGGYEYEGADASLILEVKRILGLYKPSFKLISLKCITEQPRRIRNNATAVLNLEVDGKETINAADGEGPVHALDRVLRRALKKFYPSIEKVHLVDYKVRVLNSEANTAAKVRVLITTTDGEKVWNTVGVSRDVIEASWLALTDSFEFCLQ